MIPAERSHLRVAAKSHPGMSGKNNEDRYAVSAYRLSEDNPLPALMCVVSDGIGGHRAGEVAAQTAVEAISHEVAASDGSQPLHTLKEAILSANQAIAAAAESDSSKQGMGATCACCWIIDDRLYTANIGDSRIYLVRGGAIRQISTDHTWVQEAIEAGILSPEQGRNHPNAHVLRRHLGSKQPVEPEFRLRLSDAETPEQAKANQGLRLNASDQLVLCSDGLTDLVNDDEILSELKSKPQDQALDVLIALANERGGHDNITVISIQVPETARKVAPKKRANKMVWACLVSWVIILLVTALVVAGVFYMLKRSEGGPTATATSPAATAVTPSASETPATPTAPAPTLTSPSGWISPGESILGN